MSEDEQNSMMGAAGAIIKDRTGVGEWIGGEALADPLHTGTVRVRGGVTVVAERPFVDAREQFVGYGPGAGEGLRRAIASASRWPRCCERRSGQH